MKNTYKKITQSKVSWHNIILALSFFVLGYLGSHYYDKFKTQRSDADMSLFWGVWNTLEERYPFEQPNNEDKIYGAISGLVSSYGDEYSSFFPPAEGQFFNESIGADEFGGIGVEITVQSGFLTVISPLKGSPGESAGILPGDIVTHVDAVDISGMSLDAAIMLIRGKEGTDVTLTVARHGQEERLEITVTRDIVVIPVLDTEIINDAFIIHLYNFNEKSEEPFKNALIEFRESSLNRLVIDVRNNPGGYLTSAIDIASYFVPQGKILLREQQGEGSDDEVIYRSAGYDLLEGLDFETIVLINEGSASASEILAGALVENAVASSAGTQSYGKGSVQEVLQLPKGTLLKLTVSRWLTPEGNQISEIGIEPEYQIEQKIESTEDSQLLETLELFN